MSVHKGKVVKKGGGKVEMRRLSYTDTDVRPRG